MISDLLDPDAERGLGALRARGFETWVLRLRAREDEDPVPGAARISAEDAETLGRRLFLLGRRGREEYRRRQREDLEHLSAVCSRGNLRLVPLGTWRSLPSLVFEDLRQEGLVQ